MVSQKFVLLAVFALVFGLLLAGCAQAPLPSPAPVQLANPASTYCLQNNGTLKITAQADGSEIGICTLPDGQSCEEWAYFRGDCPKPLAPPPSPAPAPSAAPPAPAPPACADDNCRWSQVKAATDAQALDSLCAQFSSPSSLDICRWFSAGVRNNRAECQSFSNARYNAYCIQELNGQSTCSPSQCKACFSAASCADFPTCAWNVTCTQQSALANGAARPQSSAPSNVGGVS